MANTIRIKRSTISGAPGSLADAELAISFDNAGMGGGASGTGDLYVGANGNVYKLAGRGDVTKLSGIEELADVTDATNVDAAGAVMEADYNANTILAATVDDTPVVLTIAASTIVGRTSGGDIDALTATEVRTLINVEDNAAADQIASEVTSTATGDIVATNVQDAIVELETDKIAKSGGTMTGVLTLSADPDNPLEAATKSYVDLVAQGLDAKDSVLNTTTANVTLSGEQTIDGVLTATSRILVKNQTLPRENGIYVTAAGAWVRSEDVDTWNELVSAFVFVEEGTANADSGWVCTVDAGGTLDTTDVTFVQFSSAGSYTADGLGIELVGNEFQLELDGTTLSKSASGLKAEPSNIDHDSLLNFAAAEHIDWTITGAEDIHVDRITATAVTQHEGSITHDNLNGVATNDHIDHSTVTLTAGEGLTGGGTIAANRTFALDVNGLTTETVTIGSADFIAFYDVSAAGHKKIFIDNLLDGGTY